MHNNKQNKVPLRNDGIDLPKLRLRTETEAAGKGLSKEEAKYDTMLWSPQLLSSVKGTIDDQEGYVEYTMEDWDGLWKNAPKGSKL